MYIAYSALRNADQPNTTTPPVSAAGLSSADDARLSGYLAACAKYSNEIAAIQQYLPGWMPKLPAL